MNKVFYLVCILIISSSVLIPAYAEVTTLTTDANFYKGGSKILFSGTILSTDQPEVTVLIFDPNNQFLLVASGLADSANHTFQVTVDTSTPDNQAKFATKGVYNATAFVQNKTSGKTVSFVFSPDGSPITPSTPSGLTAVARSTTEIDLTWSASTSTGGVPISGYKIERNDGNGFNVIQNTQATTYQDTGLAPNTEHSYRVSAVNLGGASAPSNIAIVTTLLAQPTTNPSPIPNQGQNQSLSDLLQQRLEAAKKLQEQLNAQNPQYLTADLSEKLGVYDIVANPTTQSAQSANNSTTGNLGNNSTGNFIGTFDSKNILYPIIAVVGAGIIGIILYLRKKGSLKASDSDPGKKEPPPPAESARSETISNESDEDYAMMILKNRLVKGEITVDEFKSLRDALNEP